MFLFQINFMKKFFKNHFLPFVLLSVFVTGAANAQDTLLSTDHSLSGQYKDLLQKSKRNDQGFEIINPERLQSFHKNVTDSLNSNRQKLAEAQSKLKNQNAAINSLNAGLKTKEENLTKSENMINTIGFLGIQINKSTYNMVMWGVVLLLAAILAFTLFQSVSYRKEARYRIKLFEDLSEEFQAYKVKANDKEKKLARELQTEKNRLDELTSR
jgi:hypothetical protein